MFLPVFGTFLFRYKTTAEFSEGSSRTLSADQQNNILFSTIFLDRQIANCIIVEVDIRKKIAFYGEKCIPAYL